MKRALPLLLPLLALPGAVSAGVAPAGARGRDATVLIGDFFPDSEDGLSVALPYLAARAVNSGGSCRAVLMKGRPSGNVKRLYDSRGAPRAAEAERLCAISGAGCYILGRIGREDARRKKPGSLSLTLYIGSPSEPSPAVLRTRASGANAVLTLAGRAAAKACPSPRSPPVPYFSPVALPRFARVLRLFRKGDLEGAESAIKKARAENPGSGDACYLGGLIAAGRGAPYRALRLFTEAQNLDPGFALPAYSEGRVWLSLKRPTLAEKAFARALEIQPLFFEAAREGGITKASHEDYRGALPLLEKALELRPGDEETRYWVARCLAGNGRAPAALRILDGIIAGNPRHGPSRLLRGKIYFESGSITASVRELGAAAALMPGSEEAHTLLAECLSKQGDHGGAARELKKVLRIQNRK